MPTKVGIYQSETAQGMQRAMPTKVDIYQSETAQGRQRAMPTKVGIYQSETVQGWLSAMPTKVGIYRALPCAASVITWASCFSEYGFRSRVKPCPGSRASSSL